MYLEVRVSTLEWGEEQWTKEHLSKSTGTCIGFLLAPFCFFIGTCIVFFIGTNLFFKRRFTGESGRDPGLAVETINVFVSLKSAFSYLLFVSLKMYLPKKCYIVKH